MPAMPLEHTIFAVGDIHGQAEKLDALLGRLNGLDPTAQLVFLEILSTGGSTPGR